jgi:hypothetical protein
MNFNEPRRMPEGSADVRVFEAIQLLPRAPAAEFGKTATQRSTPQILARGIPMTGGEAIKY